MDGGLIVLNENERKRGIDDDADAETDRHSLVGVFNGDGGGGDGMGRCKRGEIRNGRELKCSQTVGQADCV